MSAEEQKEDAFFRSSYVPELCALVSENKEVIVS